MSRNYELLQQGRAELEIAPIPELKTAFSVDDVNGNGHGNAAGLDLEQMAREESLKLVQRVFLLQAGERPHAVVFAGIELGDGCSRICANTAKTLAGNISGSVCLVDANLRSPSLAQFFSVTNHPGLSDALRQQSTIRDFTQRLRPDNLWLLSCGSVATDSPSLLSSDRVKELLAQLRNEFDYVLINVSAAILDGAASLWGPLVDGVILVVEANSTRREVARKTKESLESANVRLLGAVLNNRTFPIPETIYRNI
jgi:capsular exopolysaccharide synthesis family protein